RAIEARYRRLDPDGVGLPVKPRHDRDWADNVYRAGYVAYDLGLYVGMLDALARLARPHDRGYAEEVTARAATARAAIERQLWLPARRWFAEYRAPDGFVEDHLALDTLTLLRFDAVAPERARCVLETAGRLLESGRNPDQPFGDWGVMCVFPP